MADTQWVKCSDVPLVDWLESCKTFFIVNCFLQRLRKKCYEKSFVIVSTFTILINFTITWNVQKALSSETKRMIRSQTFVLSNCLEINFADCCTNGLEFRICMNCENIHCQRSSSSYSFILGWHTRNRTEHFTSASRNVSSSSNRPSAMSWTMDQ